MIYQLISVLLIVCASGQYADNYGGSKVSRQGNPKLNVDVYYESLCPDSIRFYIDELVPVMKRLYNYINLRTIPYGKAKTYEQNGVITFECQHGEKECYGNKLHACAIEDVPFWLDFNACLLRANSDDYAADSCARLFNISPEPIKACARGYRGSQLLKYNGELSNMVTYRYIPAVYINGRLMDDRLKLFNSVCDAINNTAPECRMYRA